MIRVLEFLGFLALIGGALAAIVGAFVARQYVRPGVIVAAFGVILLVIAYLLPSLGTVDDDVDAMPATPSLSLAA